MEHNSTHQDTADGGYLEKEEVADLARWVKQYHIELIPELPSFTHCYYLMTAHPELSEIPGDQVARYVCPSNPESYKLLFDVYDEYIDLLKPKWSTPDTTNCSSRSDCARVQRQGHRRTVWRGCPEDPRLPGQQRGLDGIWGDRLLEGVSGKGLQPKKAPDGYTYR